MNRGHAPFSLNRSGYYVSWDAVPAWICDQCGEVLFEATEVDVIQEALTVLDQKTEVLASQSLQNQRSGDLLAVKQAS